MYPCEDIPGTSIISYYIYGSKYVCIWSDSDHVLLQIIIAHQSIIDCNKTQNIDRYALDAGARAVILL